MVSFKGTHFVQDMILTCVGWYLAYPLSDRHVEELMQERGCRWTTPRSTGGS
jgi:putative transposase